MRNPDLDKVLPEDSLIGELFIENGNQYRIVNGKKVQQIEEIDQQSKDLNLIINRVRVKDGL